MYIFKSSNSAWFWNFGHYNLSGSFICLPNYFIYQSIRLFSIYIYVVFNRGLVGHICITRQVSALVHETAWASADLLSIRSLQTVSLKFVSKYDNFLLIIQSLDESVQTEQRLNAMQSTVYMTTIYLLYAGWRWWHSEWSHCSKATRYGTI